MTQSASTKPYSDQGEAFVAGRRAGLDEAAELARRVAKGCASAFPIAENENKWRVAAWAGAADHIAKEITTLGETGA